MDLDLRKLRYELRIAQPVLSYPASPRFPGRDSGRGLLRVSSEGGRSSLCRAGGHDPSVHLVGELDSDRSTGNRRPGPPSVPRGVDLGVRRASAVHPLQGPRG